MFKVLFSICILCVFIFHTQAMQIYDIESSDAYEKFLSKSTNRPIKKVEKYRKAITEQIALRVLNFEYKYKNANLASARLYYQDKDTTNEEKRSFSYDIILDDNNNFLWSSNQQVKNALNVGNIRSSQYSILFDQKFYENLFISGVLYEEKNTTNILFNKDDHSVRVSLPTSNSTLPKSFMRDFYQEVLHSEQYILYMLTNKIHKELLNQDNAKIFNDVGKVSLVIISRFGPCKNCFLTLTAEAIHKKILDSIGAKENVPLNILFFYLNDSNLYATKNKSETGNLRFFTNDHNRMVVVHPTAFIKDKSVL